MLAANKDAKLEALYHELQICENDIRRIDNLIDSLTKQKNILLTRRSDLNFEISDLDDEEDKKWRD